MGVCILAKRVVLELSSSTNFVYSLRDVTWHINARLRPFRRIPKTLDKQIIKFLLRLSFLLLRLRPLQRL